MLSYLILVCSLGYPSGAHVRCQIQLGLEAVMTTIYGGYCRPGRPGGSQLRPYGARGIHAHIKTRLEVVEYVCL